MASDPQLQSQPATSWVNRLRPSPLRLLAPLLSVAILIGLIVRASDCGHESGAYPRVDLMPPRPVRPAQQAQLDPHSGTNSVGTAPSAPAQSSSDPGLLRSFSGGTKAPAGDVLRLMGSDWAPAPSKVAPHSPGKRPKRGR